MINYNPQDIARCLARDLGVAAGIEYARMIARNAQDAHAMRDAYAAAAEILRGKANATTP